MKAKEKQKVKKNPDQPNQMPTHHSHNHFPSENPVTSGMKYVKHAAGERVELNFKRPLSVLSSTGKSSENARPAALSK